MEFRMPLQAHHETRALVADRFDDIVALGYGFDGDIAAQVFHGLVVDRIDQGLPGLGKQRGQRRALGEQDSVAVAVI
jgi:hypothetical protein